MSDHKLCMAAIRAERNKHDAELTALRTQVADLRAALLDAEDAVIWFTGMHIPDEAFPYYWEKIRDERMPKWRAAALAATQDVQS